MSEKPLATGIPELLGNHSKTHFRLPAVLLTLGSEDISHPSETGMAVTVFSFTNAVFTCGDVENLTSGKAVSKVPETMIDSALDKALNTEQNISNEILLILVMGSSARSYAIVAPTVSYEASVITELSDVILFNFRKMRLYKVKVTFAIERLH
ncbi:conserved hypothetical protein [Klebsiella grimontii]|uniref:Uncharacterized protein n=1 Tax=Klebsiella grimontii TaxID=2058152 RepID=A0A285AV87_9ENTR|nr:conserved hypothetical protein [Klebsiella grimontii]